MNKVILMGRLTRNPEVRYSQNDSSMAVARFTLAVDRRFKRDSEATADFISCVAFGRTAEFFERYMRQGTKVCVEGRIQTGSYIKQDGNKVYTTDVVVENAEFAESKAASAPQQTMQAPQSGYNGQQTMQAPQSGYNGQQTMQAPQSGYNEQPAMQQPAYSPQPAEPAYNAPQQQSYDDPSVSANMQEAAGEGFMQIPDEMNDEGLPFN